MALAPPNRARIPAAPAGQAPVEALGEAVPQAAEALAALPRPARVAGAELDPMGAGAETLLAAKPILTAI